MIHVRTGASCLLVDTLCSACDIGYAGPQVSNVIGQMLSFNISTGAITCMGVAKLYPKSDQAIETLNLVSPNFFDAT